MGHHVFGRTIQIAAATEDEARVIAAKEAGAGHWCWTATLAVTGVWDCFVARHEDAFALND